MDQSALKPLEDARKELYNQKVEADKRARELADQLERLDDAIKLLQQALSNKKSGSTQAGERHPSKRQRNPLTPAMIGDHARELLLENGAPMKRGALLKAFDQKKIPIVGGNRSKVLGTILWRLKDEDGNPLFTSTDDGYWPSNQKQKR